MPNGPGPVSMPVQPATLGAALGLSGAVALFAFRRGSLTRSGAAGAVLVGAATYVAGGARWSALLLSFFSSSSGTIAPGEAHSVGKTCSGNG